MSHDDFATEPIPGLPARPPKGEEILWQGRPNTWALAKSSVMLFWVAGYFVLLAVWRFVSVMDRVPLERAIALSLPFVIIGGLACGLLLLFAFVQARTTMYTVTTSRVAMRIGAALTVTLNLPYKRIESAACDLRSDGTGTIAFDLQGDTRFGYLMCWPHVRPWHFRTQPALRCIPDAAHVAQLLGEAARQRIAMPEIARIKTPVETPGLPAE